MAPIQGSMSNYARPNLDGATASIVLPTIARNNFELKPKFIQMVQQMCQFNKFQDENPYADLTNLLEICNTFKANGVSEDAIHLVFSHSQCEEGPSNGRIPYPTD